MREQGRAGWSGFSVLITIISGPREMMFGSWLLGFSPANIDPAARVFEDPGLSASRRFQMMIMLKYIKRGTRRFIFRWAGRWR